MSAGALANALKEFELALDDLSSNLDFIQAASHLRPRLKDMLHWQLMDGGAKTLATTFLRQTGSQESVLYRGMVVSLSGAFEQFVRRIIRDGILILSGTGVSYDSLDEAIKKENFYRSGIALGTVHEPLDYLELDYESLAKNLGTCFGGSAQATLNAEAFAIFLPIVSPKNLADAFRRIGVNINWDQFGAVAAMQKALGKKGSRETAKAVEEYLQRFGQMRNKIAHTGSSGIVVTESDFEQLLSFFRIFGRAMAQVVESDLAKRQRG
jgi:hypothetical protein